MCSFQDCVIDLRVLQTPKGQRPFLDATLFESFAAPTRLICIFSGGSEGDLRGLKQEIPDGCATSEPNEIPFSEIDGIVDVSRNLRLAGVTALSDLPYLYQMAADVAANLAKALNERLKDPKTKQTGVRLGPFP